MQNVGWFLNCISLCECIEMLDNKGDILEETSGTGDSQAFGIGIT